jgi:acyl-CoA synthetase (AMP-forming)/AMP-acid ligase II
VDSAHVPLQWHVKKRGCIQLVRKREKLMHLCFSTGWQFPWAVTAVGGTHVMLRKVDYDLIWHHLLYDGVTHFNGAPTLQTEIVNHPKAKRLQRKVTVHTGGKV